MLVPNFLKELNILYSSNKPFPGKTHHIQLREIVYFEIAEEK